MQGITNSCIKLFLSQAKINGVWCDIDSCACYSLNCKFEYYLHTTFGQHCFLALVLGWGIDTNRKSNWYENTVKIQENPTEEQEAVGDYEF